MRRMGYWVLFVCLFILLLPLRGDAGEQGLSPGNGGSASVAALALKDPNASTETVEVEPGRIMMDSSSTAPEEPEEEILTLLTFNIHSANNSEGAVALEQIIEEIKETGAQIIGLQEVERMMPRSGYKDQAKVIAEALGYHYYYGSNINILGVQYGNAFLSKYPIVSVGNHKLPKELLEPRGLIEAMIDVGGTPYHVFVTHLGLSADERIKQVSYLNERISMKEGNVLLMGDFNNKPGSPEMDGLDPRMTDSAAALGLEDQFTYSLYTETPNVRIDRIYTSDNIELKGHESKPSAVSDHLRVITQIVHKVTNQEGINSSVGE
jgi:endonuclease/exonuclease/phosphatase family metal-dependent hydrolase